MLDLAEILPPHPDGGDLFCLDALIDRGPVPAPPPPASSQPGMAAAAPGLTPPAEAPISPSARARGAAKRQRIREGTMPSNDQSRPTAPARAAALN
nr:hypothetical protein [uncultured Sphingomonas sp.]